MEVTGELFLTLEMFDSADPPPRTLKLKNMFGALVLAVSVLAKSSGKRFLHPSLTTTQKVTGVSPGPTEDHVFGHFATFIGQTSIFSRK